MYDVLLQIKIDYLAEIIIIRITRDDMFDLRINGKEVRRSFQRTLPPSSCPFITGNQPLAGLEA